jgi:hypothetical protein
MTIANIKIHGEDESVKLNFDLNMDLSVANAQKVMIYTIELKAKELAEADTEGNDLLSLDADDTRRRLEAQEE